MRSPNSIRALAAALSLSAFGFAPGSAFGQAKRPQKTAPAVDDKVLTRGLQSGNPAEVAAALEVAREAGSAAARVAPAIEELLARGATVKLDRAAIEALGAIGLPSSSAAIRPYMRHRIGEVRRDAVKALAQTKGPEAAAAFREGLRSSDDSVRGYAATGLGHIGAKEALPDLFLALDRNVPEAAAAIGELCDPAACSELATRFGKTPLNVMLGGIELVLFRQPPLPEDLLLDIVRRLKALGTPEAGKYLTDVQSRWPSTWSKAVKQAIDEAVSSTPGAR
jgi:HEAT repeat protein